MRRLGIWTVLRPVGNRTKALLQPVAERFRRLARARFEKTAEILARSETGKPCDARDGQIGEKKALPGSLESRRQKKIPDGRPCRRLDRTFHGGLRTTGKCNHVGNADSPAAVGRDIIEDTGDPRLACGVGMCRFPLESADRRDFLVPRGQASHAFFEKFDRALACTDCGIVNR